MNGFRRGGVSASAAAEFDSSGVLRDDALARQHDEEAFKKTVARELYRSRRYGRHLALLGAPAVDRKALDTLTFSLRMLDRVWSEGDQVYVLLPEADRAEAEGLLQRLAGSERALLEVERARVAVFPDDALTSEALIEAARVIETTTRNRRRERQFHGALTSVEAGAQIAER